MRASFQNIRHKLLRGIGKVGSRTIILCGFAIVILLGLLPILYSEWAIERSARTINRFVDVDEKIAELSLTSMTKMVKARRNEKDFLLSRRDFGFNEAKARYITPVLSIIADIKENMNRIRLLTSDPDIVRLSQGIDRAINSYETGLVSYIELHGLLGNQNTGLEGKIRSTARAMEDLLNSRENGQLMLILLSLRMSEKDYLLDDLDMNFSKTQVAAERFRTQIERADMPLDLKKRLQQFLTAYRSLLKQYAQTDDQLTATRQVYLKALQTVEPTLEKLYTLSVNNAYKANSGIKRLERQIKVTIIVIFIMVFFLSLAMAAFVLNRIKEAENKAGAAQKYARYIVDSSLDMIIAVDTERRIIEFNKAAEEVFGYRKDEIVGKNIELLYRDAEENAKVRNSMLSSGRFVGEIINIKKNRELFPALLSASVIKDPEGKPTGFMGVSRDITERKIIEEELKASATLDKLTGIYNRRKLESLLESELERAARYGSQLSLIMIDVDFFKKINDTYGHLAGDDVLRALSVVVKDNIRKADFFGRWGGEEFLILAPETAGEETSELAEKIRRLIETHPFENVGGVTISCGITQFQENDGLDTFIKRADDALYRAKNQGRNRVVVER